MDSYRCRDTLGTDESLADPSSLPLQHRSLDPYLEGYADTAPQFGSGG